MHYRVQESFFASKILEMNKTFMLYAIIILLCNLLFQISLKQNISLGEKQKKTEV